MGCASSSVKGQDLNTGKPSTESFFPPADTNGDNDYKKQVTNNKPTTVAEAPSGTRRSPQPKKTAYRPPSPIPDLPKAFDDKGLPAPLAPSKPTAKDVLANVTVDSVAKKAVSGVKSSQKKTRKISDDEGSLGEFEVFGDGDREVDLAFREDDARLRSVEINSEDLAANSNFKEKEPSEHSDEGDFFKAIEKMPRHHKKSYHLGETPQPSSESGMRFDELYRLKGVLGTGAFSTVREGYHRSNGKVSYAVKCINRKKLSEEDEAALLDEVAILKEMKHVHIIRLYDFFIEPSTYYLVMERMRGGELFDRIVAKAYYNEKEARDTCKIVLEAVGYCHKNHVAHRDLKPENLLLLSESDDSAVKIADFGFAKKVHEKNSLTTQCGTPGYVAPEILEGTPYDERADMWSVGVILYILLGGYPPFIESTQRDLFRKIRKGEYEFHEEYWGTVSSDAKRLISSLLTVDPRKRLTARGAMENQWIMGDDAKLARNDLGANLYKLRNFNAKRKLRAAVSAIIAMNRLNLLSSAFSAN